MGCLHSSPLATISADPYGLILFPADPLGQEPDEAVLASLTKPAPGDGAQVVLHRLFGRNLPHHIAGGEKGGAIGGLAICEDLVLP